MFSCYSSLTSPMTIIASVPSRTTQKPGEAHDNDDEGTRCNFVLEERSTKRWDESSSTPSACIYCCDTGLPVNSRTNQLRSMCYFLPRFVHDSPPSSSPPQLFVSHYLSNPQVARPHPPLPCRSSLSMYRCILG